MIANPTVVGTELYVLTNRHVVVKASAKWKTVSVVQGATIRNEFNRLYVDAFTGFIGTNARILKSSRNPDLALLVVTVRAALEVPPKLKLTSDCGKPAAPLYTVGFSDVNLRLTSRAGEPPAVVPIDKSWSTGNFIAASTEEFERGEHETPRPPLYLNDLSVDVLRGGSGGPLLNELGEVWGVMDFSYSSGSNGFRYVGRDAGSTQEDPRAQSSAIRCEELRSFINNETSVFDHEIWFDQDP